MLARDDPGLRSLWWQLAGSELPTSPLTAVPEPREREPVLTITLTLAEHPGVRTFISSSLSFLTCKMGIIRISTSKEITDANYEAVHFYNYSEGDLGSSHVILRVHLLSRCHISIISFNAHKDFVSGCHSPPQHCRGGN